MNRREVLRRTTIATGAALVLPLHSALLSGCTSRSTIEEAIEPMSFTIDDYSLLEEMADTLLPATDSQSASEAGVVSEIDKMVAEVYSDTDRIAYQDQFKILAEHLQAEEFSDSSEANKIEVLKQLESSTGRLKDAWIHVKQQIIALYLSSESIAENHLNYMPVPGTYEACIKLSETNGKAWAI